MIFGRPTRRQLATGLGATLAVLAAPASLCAQPQPATADGYRLLRPKFGKPPLRGPDQAGTVMQCFDGAVPGPLLRVKQGEELKVRLINSGLPDPVSIHWHGLRIPAAVDNGLPVKPNETRDYRFTPPDAGTFWYHAPLDSNDVTGRGLYGALIVDERTPPDIDRDLLLVFDNWKLNSDGVLSSEGEHLTVNGAPAFDIAVKANERVRLRLLNAAPHRPLPLKFDRHLPTVMALDGQPAQPFIAESGVVVLGPGSRVDLFVDMTLKPGETAAMLAQGAPLFRFIYDAGAPARPSLRDDAPPLPANPLPETMNLAGALRRDVVLPLIAQADAPLVTAARGRTVVLAFLNTSTNLQTVHLHGHHFRLLDQLDDGWKPFWLDTLVLPPKQTWRIAFVADNPGRWALDARMIGGAATAATAWFEVT